jgi:hypothetical protein
VIIHHPLQFYEPAIGRNYYDTDATAVAYIDGVGTINHEPNNNNKLQGGSGYPSVPDVVIFGAGMEANYTSSIRAKDNKKDHSWKKNNILEKPTLVDQGIEYDPHSTLAVALYPTKPYCLLVL